MMKTQMNTILYRTLNSTVLYHTRNVLNSLLIDPQNIQIKSTKKGHAPQRACLLSMSHSNNNILIYGTVPFSSVLEFVCLPWSEVCSARVTSLLLLLLLLYGTANHCYTTSSPRTTVVGTPFY